MATFNAPDVLLPSAGLNLTDFIVKLKKGEMGFGFDTFGGQEYGTQVVIIGSIDEGGPADGHLMAGDQIHMVNGVNVNGARHSHVNGLISNAGLVGEVELGIHRNLTGSEHTEWQIEGKERNPSTNYLDYHYGIPAQRSSNTEAATYGSDEFTTRNQTMESGPKGKNVVVLKSDDVNIKGPTVFMPNTIEMANLKKPKKGQFETGVQISSTMTDADVEKKLREIFPILRDETIRFYCASHKAKEGPMLLFDGIPRVWDGKSIKKKIRGNSALYILLEVPGTSQIRSQVMQSLTPGSHEMNSVSDSSVHHQQTVEAGEPSQHFPHTATIPPFINQELENSDHVEAMDTSTGIMNTEDRPLHTPVPSGDESALLDRSDSGHGQSDKSEVGRSQEDHLSVPSDADPLIRSSELQSNIVAIFPSLSSLQGGIGFVLILDKALPEEIKSARAFFGNVPVEVTNMNGSTLTGKVPASDKPGTVTVTVQSKDVIFLGDISFEYIDDEETSLSRLVKDPRFLKKFFTKMAEEQDKKTCECEKQFNLQPPYNDTTADYDAEERYMNHLESNLIKESGYSADVESSSSVSSDSESSDSAYHTSKGVVEGGNATQKEKNYPADTNVDDNSSSFSLLEFTNAANESPSPEKESGVAQSVTEKRNNTPSAAKERDVTRSAGRKIDFTPSAEQKNVTSSSEIESDYSGVSVSFSIEKSMPLIKKQGYLKGPQCERILEKLEILRDSGQFNEHEHLVTSLLKLCSDGKEPDMQLALIIEQGVAFAYQKESKKSKRVFTSVIKSVQTQICDVTNPGILTARAYFSLVAGYGNRESVKLSSLFECLRRSEFLLQHHDSPDDWAELYYTYGSVWLKYMSIIPDDLRNAQARETARDKAKYYYEQAISFCQRDKRPRVQIKGQTYCHLGLAALLLDCSSTAARTQEKEVAPSAIKTAKAHLDFVQYMLGESVTTRTRVQLLKTRSDQFYRQRLYQLAKETAEEAFQLASSNRFNTELDTLQERIQFLDVKLEVAKEVTIMEIEDELDTLQERIQFLDVKVEVAKEVTIMEIEDAHSESGYYGTE